ncbi:hypothetical protein MSIBF_A590003 [groundwater metagenome]|uniref:NAD-dependent epimerase/dehydratase domain-containing protein n=1 Tax=groundwater metagenome TaxID=717931 RepID=A0A098EFM4_9ZZZZ
MNWKNKKILVTGAGGFIGSHLTERLVELDNTKAKKLIGWEQKISLGDGLKKTIKLYKN